MITFIIIFVQFSTLQVCVFIVSTCVVLKDMTSFSQISQQESELGKLMAAVNSRK